MRSSDGARRAGSAHRTALAPALRISMRILRSSIKHGARSRGTRALRAPHLVNTAALRHMPHILAATPMTSARTVLLRAHRAIAVRIALFAHA